jgi:hypothetical protein
MIGHCADVDATLFRIRELMALTPEADDERVDSKRHEQEREAQAEQEHSPKPLDPPFSIILYKPIRLSTVLLTYQSPLLAV